MSSRPLFLAQSILTDLGVPVIRRLLIANRGEIACRVIRTCQALGIVTVAVYTHEDQSSTHVQEADEAVCLGHASEGNHHQDIDLLISIAKRLEVDAIHPGYGYLSENAEFAHAVRENGLIFIGPSPDAISALGDKRIAKEYLSQYAPEVPLIPGYSGQDQDPEILAGEAKRIGYPVLIKASAGGGGKGMRIVHEERHFKEELARAQSEAQRSFSNSDCILEKYISRGKHIEIQIMGDRSGDVRSLFDRECSIQRRHQKVVEESPSPWLSDDMRQRMGEAAVAIGKLMKYESAGTVEFMVDIDTQHFYFLEVNTRIQVEHPITEEVTGIDIVALQLYVAAGGLLNALEPINNLRQQGHAIECRLCAEDPERNFVPDLGRVWRWQASHGPRNASNPGRVRIETSLQTGSNISVFFDPMIAKIVVWAPTRTAAIQQMAMALDNLVCLGVRTNQAFLKACIIHENFKAVDYSTNFIPDNLNNLLQSTDPFRNAELAVDRLSMIASIFLHSSLEKYSVARPFSGISGGFRLQSRHSRTQTALQGDIWKLRSSGSVIRPALLTRIHPVGHTSKPSTPTWHFHAERFSETDPDPNASLQAAQSVGGLYTSRVSKTLRHASKNSVFEAVVLSCNLQQFGPSPSWILGDVSVLLDQHHFTACLATDVGLTVADSGEPQKIFCHIPGIGSFEFHRYSRLAYGESLRQVANDAAGTVEGICKAPMPCKVFQVLKKDGDRVGKGDVLLVVESMKMEMKIVSPADGEFRCSVAEAQAVDEGTVLCEVIMA